MKLIAIANFCHVQRGKDKKIYPYDCMMTPYDKLKAISKAKNYLKPDITFEILDKVGLLLAKLMIRRLNTYKKNALNYLKGVVS